MADVPQAAGGVINVPTTDTGTPSTLAVITIVKRAMRIVGSFSDPVVKQVALEEFQNCINDTNIRNTFDFMTAKDTDVTLVEDQREYAIPDSAFALKALVLVKDTETPEEIRPLGYLDWDQQQRLFLQAGSGFSSYWSARDIFFDRKVELARPPNEAMVSDGWKLRIWYMAALQTPPINDENIAISAPIQVSTGIQRYLEWRLLTVFGDPRDPRRREAHHEWDRFFKSLKGMENRSRPGGPQIRPQGMVEGNTGFNGRRWPAGGR